MMHGQNHVKFISSC